MAHKYVKVSTETLLLAEREILPSALSDDYEAVKVLLLILASAIEQEMTLTPKLSAFLAGALRNISNGKRASDELHIKRKRGQRDITTAIERSINYVFKIKMLLSENNSTTIDDAIWDVADKHGAEYETVKAAWRDYRHTVELHTDGNSAFFDLTRKKKAGVE